MRKFSRVYVEITNICNRNCSFCPGTKRSPRSMTYDEFMTVARKLKGRTDYIYFHVMGEPLIHPELCNFIKYAADLGYKCVVTTNGTLIDRRKQELLESGIYKINISVHSFEDGADEEYLSYLETLCGFANESCEKGILTILRLWNKGHDGGRNDRTLEILQEKLSGEWLWGTRGARIRHKLHLEYGDRFEWPDKNADSFGDEVFCYGLRDHFGVLSDGRVIPCCLDREGEITLGNIFNSDIEEILDSQRAIAIRRGFDSRHATEELCKRCGYAQRFL